MKDHSFPCACSMKGDRFFPCMYHWKMLPIRIQEEMRKQELIWCT